MQEPPCTDAPLPSPVQGPLTFRLPCLFRKSMNPKNVHIARHRRLSQSELQALAPILASASLDQFIGDFDFTHATFLGRLFAITHGPCREMAGFFAPRKQMASGAMHWRCGPLFLAPELRGQGIMAAALLEFFSSHRPGIVWIDDQNFPSKSMFSRLGFIQSKPLVCDGRAGHWHVLPRLT